MLSEFWRSSGIRVVAGGVVAGFHCIYNYQDILGLLSYSCFIQVYIFPYQILKSTNMVIVI